MDALPRGSGGPSRPCDGVVQPGIALEDRRRPNDAVKAYERAIAADRRLADAYFNLARLYEQAGKRAAALRNLSKCRLLTEE
jgi:tetratricopeptide (TPR) repeat protein